MIILEENFKWHLETFCIWTLHMRSNFVLSI